MAEVAQTRWNESAKIYFYLFLIWGVRSGESLDCNSSGCVTL
jgi:hypothetical protein